MKQTPCTTCQGTGLDDKHKWPDGSPATCETCDGYGDTPPTMKIIIRNTLTGKYWDGRPAPDSFQADKLHAKPVERPEAAFIRATYGEALVYEEISDDLAARRAAFIARELVMPPVTSSEPADTIAIRACIKAFPNRAHSDPRNEEFIRAFVLGYIAATNTTNTTNTTT